MDDYDVAPASSRPAQSVQGAHTRPSLVGSDTFRPPISWVNASVCARPVAGPSLTDCPQEDQYLTRAARDGPRAQDAPDKENHRDCERRHD